MFARIPCVMGHTRGLYAVERYRASPGSGDWLLLFLLCGAVNIAELEALTLMGA